MANYRWSFIVSAIVLLTGCTKHAPPAAVAPQLVSGIELAEVDPQVRAQDDLYLHVNGKWLARTEIPKDKGGINSFDQLYDATQENLRGIIEGLTTESLDPATADPDRAKIADLYRSFMDEKTIEGRGLQPVAPQLAKIAALRDATELPPLMGELSAVGFTVPFAGRVHQDAKNPEQMVFDLSQDGLGMPDRDYYLLKDPKLVQIRAEYLKHVRNMLALSGDGDAERDAGYVLDLETRLARAAWTKVASRDPVRAYNRLTSSALQALTPRFDWKAYFKALGGVDVGGALVVSQPSYVKEVGVLMATTPIMVWKAYLRWHVLSDMAPFLSKQVVDEHFAFYGTTLRGVPEQKPRWKRSLDLIDESLGEALGKLYVARFFPPAAKVRMDELIKNLLAAYRADIDGLDWMSPETKAKAKEKLAKFTPKIGYPATWRDYSALQIDKNDLIGNVLRARAFEYQRNLHKLGKPVDRSEWGMTPQTINAYYNPEWNEIVFPAAILQPPFFNALADDAVNYGGIGSVIGHEVSHGFDDEGSQYDGDGKLLGIPGWFTKEDMAKFKERTRGLVAQYAAYAPVPGFPINGELTLGENIGDNSGLVIALKAYRLALAGKTGPVMDGLTGEQRFFYSWARVWRSKERDNQAIMGIKADPHSPNQFRGRVPVMNLQEFHEAFATKEGDKMYLAPDKRITLW